MPKRFSPPPELEEAIIIAETSGITYDMLEYFPERVIHDIIMYKNVKEVVRMGGSYEV